ncbi:Rv1733c family protein [Kutzneria sp. CA-103260]|uniref:Rv1733c family protein n=1 Tax=Kutzneria sp. CA-103260 TaxID=2802641 RepID=UPI001BAA4139|nr:hypothetical protein [Kutzneria sp. CA-103260]QUQ64069.1 transmembrane protein [Kutzneria sp. CA-103260]
MGRFTQPDPLLGLARRIGWGRNTLRRTIDRCEAASVVLVWLASTVIMLGGVVLGLTVTQSDLATSARQIAQSHPTTGVMLDSSIAAPGSTAMRMSVQVRYIDQTGVTRTAETVEAVGLPAGTSVPVWLDGSGAIAPDPLTPDDAVVNGVTAGTCAAGGAEGLLLAVYLYVRWRMERRKFAAIDLEWAQLSAR